MKRLSNRHLVRLTFGLWAILLAVSCVRPVFKPTSSTVYTIYANAGANFWSGDPLYAPSSGHDVFRYFPVAAAWFGPWSLLPLGVGGALWRVLGAALFLTGLGAWFRRLAPQTPLAILFLVALPLSIGSLSNAQANTHITGLMLWATVLAGRDRWRSAGILSAIAVLFKGYPIALCGLLFLLAPRRFGIPVALATAVGLALPYAVQDGNYVSSSYRGLFHSLAADDRSERPLFAGYQDFPMLLRIAGIPISRGDYLWVEAGAGLAAAALVGHLMRRGRERSQLALECYTIGASWMLVFGPAVEASTFILFAPVMACEMALARMIWARIFSYTGSALLLLSVVLFAFPHSIHRPIVSLGILPGAAVLLSIGALSRIGTSPAEVRAMFLPSDTGLRRAA